MNVFLQQILARVRRSPTMVLSLSVLLLLGIANYFLWQRHSEIAEHHERAHDEGEAVLLALTGHGRIQAQLATVQEALAFINKNLIVENDLAGNLDYFYQMEKTTRVRLADLSQLGAQPMEADSPFKIIPFSLRLTGQYYQLISFLHELQTGPRLLRIKNYSFNRADPATNTLALELTVEVLSHP